MVIFCSCFKLICYHYVILGCACFADFVCKFLCVLIAFLIALQWKDENLFGEKQPKFTEKSTPLTLRFETLGFFLITQRH